MVSFKKSEIMKSFNEWMEERVESQSVWLESLWVANQQEIFQAAEYCLGLLKSNIVM
jgi:hypothetical protein